MKNITITAAAVVHEHYTLFKHSYSVN